MSVQDKLAEKKAAAPKSNHAAIKDQELVDFEWRTGTKKTAKAKCVYAMVGAKPSKDDVLIGEMKSPTIAESLIEDHNSWLES